MTSKGIKKTSDVIKPFLPMLISDIDLSSEEDLLFELNQPHTVTVKKRTGAYAKRPLIGGEKFCLKGVYEGKRDGLIFKFQPQFVTTDYSIMEMNAEEAIENMDDFEKYIEGIIEKDIDDAVEEARKEGDKKEADAYIDRQKLYGDKFGSW